MKKMGISYACMAFLTILLIGFGIHLKSQYPEMSLATALEQNNVREIKRAAQTASDKEKRDAILEATTAGYSEGVRLLLEADPMLANTSYSWGSPILSYAAAEGNVAIVKNLVRAGADITKKNQEEETPLLTTIANNFSATDDPGRVEIVKVLTSHANAPATINVKSIHGFTPLSKATSQSKQVGFIQELLKVSGIDVNIPYCKSGECFTPLMLASQAGNIDAVKLLLEKKPDINQRNEKNGMTAFKMGATEEIRKLLLDHGANPRL